LDEADAIIKAPDDDSVKLQQAEEEISIVVCDLTTALFSKKKGEVKNVSTLNAASVRKDLVECGVPNGLVDHIRHLKQPMTLNML
jgi:molybdopterin-guanine dinucleotide biosynthesis protein